MKILAVADEESPALWDAYVPGRLADYDLIISCGDLKPEYLSFLVTMARAPLLYVHGNHDGLYESKPPEGCDSIDDRLVVYNGVRILGLGGCLRYHEGPHQYTEKQMRRRIAKLAFAIWRCKGVDIVVTHAPPRGCGDRDDPAHRGFEALLKLIERRQPAFLLHGHVHLRYDHTLPREQRLGSTRVINVSERFVLDIPDKADADPRKKNKLIWKNRRRNSDDGFQGYRFD